MKHAIDGLAKQTQVDGTALEEPLLRMNAKTRAFFYLDRHLGRASQLLKSYEITMVAFDARNGGLKNLGSPQTR